MIKVAIISGGNSAERGISELSAKTVLNFLDNKKYDARIIDILHDKWVDLLLQISVDKNDFSIQIDERKWMPDVIFCAIHGSPLEDGLLQGYFETIRIPYTNCDGATSSLTMNKYLTKKVCAETGVSLAQDALILKSEFDKNTFETDNFILKWQLPVFVKPNNNGSSFGVSKVKEVSELIPAIEDAFLYSDAVLIEQAIKGKEVGNGVLMSNGEVIVLPITEIQPENEFFDFASKYEGKSKEITPAHLDLDLAAKVKLLSKSIYLILNCKGFVRVDYIISGNDIFLLEVNTVPGLTEASIIPQQAIAHGWSLSSFFDLILKESINSFKNK